MKTESKAKKKAVAKKPVEPAVIITCSRCDGNGYCDNCYGDGEVVQYVSCDDCYGNGKCPDCNGRGAVEER